MILEASLALAGGALFRLRGSSLWHQWTGRGATTIRLAWASGLAACALAIATLPWWHYLAIVAALYLGSVAPWWDSLDMGRISGDVAGAVARHTARGVVWTGPAAAVLGGLGIGQGLWLIAAGLACGAIYFVSSRLQPSRSTENAEWVFGTAIAAALIAGLAPGS